MHSFRFVPGCTRHDAASRPDTTPSALSPQRLRSLITLPSGFALARTLRHGSFAVALPAALFVSSVLPQAAQPEPVLSAVAASPAGELNVSIAPARETSYAGTVRLGDPEAQPEPAPVPPAEPAPAPETPAEPAPAPAAPVEAPVEAQAAPLPVVEQNWQGAADLALQFVGSRYRYGGSSPRGFDCSGLVKYVYGQMGVALPHKASLQYSTKYGERINSMADLKAGDLVFFAGTTRARGITHVALYVGDGMMVSANTPRTGVQYVNLYSKYWRSHYAGGLRIYR